MHDKAAEQSKRGDKYYKIDSSDSEDEGRHKQASKRLGGTLNAISAKDAEFLRQVQPVELAEFQKICLRRRDICKWFEHPDY